MDPTTLFTNQAPLSKSAKVIRRKRRLLRQKIKEKMDRRLTELKNRNTVVTN